MTQKPKWDGRSRIPNDTYRKNFIKIFGAEPPEEDKLNQEQTKLNKKETDDKKK
jgi:hypothetical protein